MTHPLTPREKVAQIVRNGMNRLAASQAGARPVVSASKEADRVTDAILTALSSGSGDHAELARLAETNKAYGFLVSVHPEAILALLAENAALREKVRTEIKLSVDNYVRATARATEAERKLAEAVGLNDRAAELMRQCTDPERFEGASTLNVYANMRAWLSDISKEAERG